MSLSQSGGPTLVPTTSAAESSVATRGFGREHAIAQHLDRVPSALVALLIQVVATAAALALDCLVDLAGLTEPWTFWALVQAALAVLLASAAGQAHWWIAIHSVFVPAALLVDRMALPPWLLLGAAGLLALTNSNALRERVPLFLSSRRARDLLVEQLPADRPIGFVEAGCGFGGVLATVAAERPTRFCLGLETAWLPYVVSRLRCVLQANATHVLRRSLWRHDLSDADVVYAYLSPVPMARLWRQACAQMRPGTLLISNSFTVPGVTAEVALPVGDATGSVLYVYRVPAQPASAAASDARS